MKLEATEFRSPIGPLIVLAHDGRLVGLEFTEARGRTTTLDRDLARHFGASGTVRASDPAGAVNALTKYFAGDLEALDRVPVDLRGTAFQLRAWAALRAIPAGTTRTYAQQAAAIGSPRAVRAVGSANARNPVSLVIPCHRVVATGGGLGGYGGGLDRKRWLIAHEAAHARGVKDGASRQLALGVPAH